MEESVLPADYRDGQFWGVLLCLVCEVTTHQRAERSKLCIDT